MRKINVIFSFFFLAFFILLLSPLQSSAIQELNEDDFESKILVFGEQLTNEQRNQVETSFGIELNDENIKRIEVTSSDLHNYIGGDINSNMFSSALIYLDDDIDGLEVNIKTPQNITSVTIDMYKNAALTAGVEDAIIEIASPIQVVGTSALSGIYKAFDSEGIKLDNDRMDVANEELELATKLSKKDNISEEDISNLLTEVKKEMANKDPTSKKEIQEIIEETINKLEINISDEDKKLLYDLFEKMSDLNIDFGKVRVQLNELSNLVSDKIKDLDVDKEKVDGILNKIKNIMQDIINWISNLF